MQKVLIFFILFTSSLSFARSFPKIKFKMFMMHSSSVGVQLITPEVPYDIDILKSRTRTSWFDSVQNLNDDDFKTYLESNVENLDKGNLNDVWTQEAIENFLIKRRLSRATHLSEEELVNFSVDQIKHKNFEQKVNFFRSLFLDMGYIYDYKRTQGKGDIEIGLNKLFDGLRNLYESDKSKVGVCRDMHQGVLKIMKKSGIDTAFGSSYITPSSAHINIIMTDPNDKNKVIGLNYEHVEYKKGKPGQSLLTMNHANPSIGFGFYIWNEKDRVELYVPSDKAILLYKATSGNLEEFNPFILEDYKIVQGEAETSLGKLALFYAMADSGDGTKVGGIALNDKFKFKSKFLKGNHGSALFISNRAFEFEDSGVNTYGYYGRVFLEALKELKLSRNSKIKFNITTLVQFAAFYAKVKNDFYQIDSGKFKFDGSLALGAGVHLMQKFSLIDHKLSLSIEGLPQTADITKFSLYHPMSGGFDIGFSRLLLEQNLRFKRFKGIRNSLYWKMMYHKLGTFNIFLGQVGVDLNVKKINTTFGVKAQDCLSNNCPVWMIGSRRSIQMNFLNNKYKKVSFGANGMINEYDRNQYYFGLLLKGEI